MTLVKDVFTRSYDVLSSNLNMVLGVCYRLSYLSMQCTLRPKNLTHEVLEHWGIGLRKIPGLHHLRPSTCNLRFPQALCDERREQGCPHGICVINLPGGQRVNCLRFGK